MPGFCEAENMLRPSRSMPELFVLQETVPLQYVQMAPNGRRRQSEITRKPRHRLGLMGLNYLKYVSARVLH